MPNEPSDSTRETRLVETRPVLPAPRAATTGLEAEVLLRFGPGVPAEPRPQVSDDDGTQPRSSGRRWRVVNLVLTAALALVVLWLLWPSQPIEVRQVTVRAPDAVTCGDSADVVATLRTNGRAGDVRYRWVRNDGMTSDVLTARAPKGKDTVDVHLRWTFTGPGTYAAQATIEVVEPRSAQTATSFTYRC